MATASVYTDGATDESVPGCGAGAVMFDESGKIIWTLSEYLCKGSTTFGEMTAIYRAIKHAKDIGVVTLKLYPDDGVSIHLVNGTKQSKKPDLQSLASKVSAAAKAITLTMDVSPAGGSQNAAADKLANAALRSISREPSPSSTRPQTKISTGARNTLPDGKQLWLKCPFNEKDAVKSLGARWSPDEKKWYVQDTPDNREKFAKWIAT